MRLKTATVRSCPTTRGEESAERFDRSRRFPRIQWRIAAQVEPKHCPKDTARAPTPPMTLPISDFALAQG